MSATLFAPSVNALWKLIELYGHNPRPLFKAHGISVKVARDPNARVRRSQVLAVWEHFAEQVDDPCFALRLAEVLHPSHIGAMGYGWLASTSLRTGFNRLIRYSRFLTDAVQLEIRETNKGYSIFFTRKLEMPKDVLWEADADMAFLIWLCRMNAGSRLNPISVALVHVEPECSSEYFGFFKCPVQFGARRNRLTFRRADIDRELDTANPHLAQLHDQVMIKAIARLNTSRIVDRTRAAVIEELPSGRVTDNKIAEMLSMSTRTFQRKLREEGTSYKAVLNQIRRELARTYIRNNRLTLTEISYQLGFSEVSAFSSAYKRWTGRSPSEERQAA